MYGRDGARRGHPLCPAGGTVRPAQLGGGVRPPVRPDSPQRPPGGGTGVAATLRDQLHTVPAA